MITLLEAEKIVKEMPKYLHPTGSFIRNEPKLNDIDFLTTKDLDQVIKEIPFNIKKFLRTGEKHVSLLLNNNVKIDVWKIEKGTLNTEKLSRDYERGLVIGMRKKAMTMGYTLNNHGLFKKGIKVSDDIKDIFKILDIEFRKP